MKKKGYILFGISGLIMFSSTVVANEEDEELVIDFHDIKNESYDNIHGNYKHFDFFSTNIIELIEWKYQQSKNLLIEKQNIIFSKKSIVRNKNYEEMQNQLFITPITFTPITKQEEKDNFNNCIWVIRIIGLIMFIYISLQKSNKKGDETVDNYNMDS